MKKTLMLQEILDQPAVLARTADAVGEYLRSNEVEREPGGRIVLTGCGDMDFSARIAAGQAAAEYPAVSVSAVSSMEMRWEAPRLAKGDVVVVSSFSGLTPRSVEALLLARERGAHVVSITGNPESTLAREADDALLLPTGPRDELNRHPYAGYHANVPQTKTFMAALFAELLLLDHLIAGQERGCSAWRSTFAALPDHVEAGIALLTSQVDPWVETLAGGQRNVVVLGSGPWRPVASYGAAKFLEMSIPSRHQCLEEFNHLELFLTGAESLVIFVCPDGRSWTRAAELVGPYEKLGCSRLVLRARSLTGEIAETPGAPSLSVEGHGRLEALFSTIVALQLLAAAIGPALGRDIDRWVGGERTELIEDLSQTTIRSSRIRPSSELESD